MPSTITVDFTILRREVGRYLGYGREPIDHDPDQVIDVQDVIDSGLRQAYWPSNGHEWSFLQPTYQFKVDSTQDDFALPPEVVDVNQALTFSKEDNSWNPVEKCDPQRIYYLREANQTTSTGYPLLFAFRPEAHKGLDDQENKLMLWPKPDQEYTLNLPVKIAPMQLTVDRPIPWGGPQFGELLLQSCLAVAELRINNEKGVHSADFQERLVAAVAVDDSRHRGTVVGYNSDNSDGGGYRYLADNHRVTYAGQYYDGAD
tara:strand:- start:176 stop:952 length:777 start_codon:yes stop_codon:yes gene_type:complete